VWRPLFALLAWLLPLAAAAQVIGLTFDDGRSTRNARAERTPHPERWSSSAAMHRVPALARSVATPALIEQWSAAGHGVGNHTAHHRSLSSGVTPTGSSPTCGRPTKHCTN
jgi:peptidoglycan/xylan/chitin deacetylase (PgdA/CDA1 family)